MASKPVQTTEDSFIQDAEVFEVIHIVNAGRKHFAEQGQLTRGNYFYNGRSQPGTRNAGTRSKYYTFLTKAPSGNVSAPKEKRPVSRPQYQRLTCPSPSMEPIGEQRSSTVWYSVVESHKQHLEAEVTRISREITEVVMNKKDNSKFVSNGKRGKERSEGIEGPESQFDESSSSSEEEMDETGVLGVRGGKRTSFKWAFGFLGKNERS